MAEIDTLQQRIRRIYEKFRRGSIPKPLIQQALEWIYMAIEYLGAAAVLEKYGASFTKPRMQLTGHAVECVMKACISTDGKNPPNTHDLVRLYRDIEKCGFQLEKKHQVLIVALNQDYFQDLGSNTKFKLRYPTQYDEYTGVSTPPHEDMLTIFTELVNQAEKRVPLETKMAFKNVFSVYSNLTKNA